MAGCRLPQLTNDVFVAPSQVLITQKNHALVKMHAELWIHDGERICRYLRNGMVEERHQTPLEPRGNSE